MKAVVLFTLVFALTACCRAPMIVPVKVIEQHSSTDEAPHVKVHLGVEYFDWALLERTDTHQRLVAVGTFGSPGEQINVDVNSLTIVTH